MYQRTPAETRWSQLLELLEERLPHERELLLEVDHVVTDRLREVEDQAIARHGQMILAAIRGDLVKYDDCMAEYRPGWADEMLEMMGAPA